MRGSAFLVAAALALGGCNMISTETPMFDLTDAGAPALRDGVWLIDDPECVVDDRTPADTWPECADWMLLEGGMMKFPGETGMTGLGNDELPVVLTGGSPRIWQVTLKSPKADKAMTLYLGFEAVEIGDDGKVVRYRSWPGQCGPLPPQPPGGPDNAADLVTRQPFPGLTLAQDGTCTPRDEAALREGVARSRTLEPGRLKEEGRWIRSRWP